MMKKQDVANNLVNLLRSFTSVETCKSICMHGRKMLDINFPSSDVKLHDAGLIQVAVNAAFEGIN